MTVSIFAPADSGEVFALLDDSSAAATPRSRLYIDHVGTLSCSDGADLAQLFAALADALAQGRFAVGVFSYELGAAMHGIVPHPSDVPPAQILLFGRCEHFNADQVAAWIERRIADEESDANAGVAAVHASASSKQFDHAIARIHAYLESGDSYQVNYTYRLRFDAYGSPVALYKKLRAAQPVPYGALIGLPGGAAILSLSPELLVRNDGGTLTAQPMKGTAPAGTLDEDRHHAARLVADGKTRAENLMIVDLLRNDLGRIAQAGSVKVPQLFAVERFGRVLQMTSTIKAEMRPDASLAEVFAALFPCGSVTGAPKRRSMQIIRELESDARGVYTGAIGWFDAPTDNRSIGDFCLAVPIRTLVLQAPQDGVRRGEMGVGAGIVHDSAAHEEYAECALKAAFLTRLPHDFQLLETMRVTSDGCTLLDRHLSRLHSSAAYFNFKFDENALRTKVERACAAMALGAAHRMRLALAQDGDCEITTAPLAPLQEPVTLLIAKRPVAIAPFFLRHKTTIRAPYDDAWRAAEQQGAFDMLFCNAQGNLTEGARSSLFIKRGGRWFTPPLSAGVLPGVMRGVLLDDPAWAAAEQELSLQDLEEAEEIVVCNALHGVLRGQLLRP